MTINGQVVNTSQLEKSKFVLDGKQERCDATGTKETQLQLSILRPPGKESQINNSKTKLSMFDLKVNHVICEGKIFFAMNFVIMTYH